MTNTVYLVMREGKDNLVLGIFRDLVSALNAAEGHAYGVRIATEAAYWMASNNLLTYLPGGDRSDERIYVRFETLS